MKGRIQHRRSCLLGALACVLALFVSGCTTEIFYREEEVIPVTEPGQPMAVKAFPWPVVAQLADIAESTPKTAIKNRVGYKRRMGLFRVVAEKRKWQSMKREDMESESGSELK